MSRVSPIKRFLFKRSFNTKERLKFYKKITQLLSNGVNLDKALYQVESSKRRGRDVIAVEVYASWRRDLENGINFGTCMGSYIPPGEAMLIESGADSGKLQKSIESAMEMLQQQQSIRSAIVGSGTYPLVMICILIASLVVVSYKVIPAFTEVLPIEEWQGASKIVANISMAIKENGLRYFLVFIGTMILVFLSLPRWTGRTRLLVEKLVPWSIYRVWQGASFLLSVASLMSAGVKIDDVSMARIARRAPPYLKERMLAVGQEMASGLNFGDALANSGYKFPDVEIIEDLRIYATLRGFEDNLVEITRDWVTEAEANVQASMKIVNFIALLLVALTIGGLISALFGVIQQVQSSIG